jgi:hypothetical protein
MDDLAQIKRHYGEKMMHLCRELFPTLLETPGLLYATLSKKFNPSRLLYEDIVERDLYDTFKSIILHASTPKEEEKYETTKTPQELLDEAGYILYECHSEEDIQSFKKYYAKGEELCTFNGGRLNICHVFFAVKKDADKIKRKQHPSRQDEYGTSVISIQFRKGRYNTLSIKNRYNHTVENPDATFSNNLENIIPGLTEAFEETYGLSINENDAVEDMPGYVLAEDGKYYKYNMEINNIYYCPGNIIIDNFRVKKLDKSRAILVEAFIIDKERKTIRYYDSSARVMGEGLNEFIQTIPEIESIKEINTEDGNKKIIINGDIEIVLNKKNQIKSYKNPHVTEIGDSFLTKAKEIESIDLPNVKKIGAHFLEKAIKLKSINIPNCIEIGDSFLDNNEELGSIDLPNVEKIGKWFMTHCLNISSINLPKCKEIGEGFLTSNKKIKSLILPNVEKLSHVLSSDSSLEELYLPICKEIEYSFQQASKIEVVDLPSVEKIGTHVFGEATNLKKLFAPKCIEIGNLVLRENIHLEEIDISSCKKIGRSFLRKNTDLKRIDISSVEEIGHHFLEENDSVEIIRGPRK